MLTEKEKDFLGRLLDDSSTTVRRAVVERLRREQEDAVTFLRERARGSNRELAGHISNILLEIGGDEPREAFVRYIRECRYDLESGCLLLERAMNPAADTSRIALFLDGVAARVEEFLEPHQTCFERCKVINRILFQEYAFKADRQTPSAPENSFLGSVIERRRGIPISLSTVYLLVAWRINLHLEPIGLPGRFCLGCFEDAEPFFLDPSERGRFRSEHEIRQYLLDQQVEDAAAYLMPSPVGEILCRYCRNLVHQYHANKRHEDVEVVSSFIREFEAVYSVPDEG